LNKDLQISLPKIEKQPVRVEQAPDGQYYFTIRDIPKPTSVAASSSPRSVAIYWDASLSRATANHELELQLLTGYLDTISNPVAVSLVVFRNVPEKTRTFLLPAHKGALLTALRAIKYDGGTQAGTIPKLKGRLDLALLFSDGLSTFGEEKPGPLGAPVYAVNSSKSSNHAFLRYLALRSGGAYINLNRTEVKSALASIGTNSFSFISAQAPGCNTCTIYPQVQVPIQGPFTVAGRLMTSVTQVVLNYGVGSRITHSRTFTINRSDAIKGNLLQRAWAQKKLDDLIIFPERNRDAISALGKEFSLVTPMTSLIVLEQLSQYVEHKIRPPASLPGMAAKYDAAMARLAKEKRQKEVSKLAHVLSLWQSRLTWYNTKFKRFYRVKKENKSSGQDSYGLGGGGRGAARISRSMSAPSPMRGRSRSMRMADPLSNRNVDEKSKEAGSAQPEASIKMEAWNPDTPYLKALKAARTGNRYTVYLSQRVKHGRAPAFYLDCADFFMKNKAKRLGLRILSNLAELELENPALLRVLAHRLNQIGELDLSILMFRKVLSLRPEEPQSYRDLGLVLERRADKHRSAASKKASAREDYSQALQLLAKVVMNKWQRFNEIEVIALTELNNIWPKAKAIGLTRLPVDKRLIKNLTMDVRIVMTWDADLTDMDLHVIEPSGEEAYYGHNRTEIGGLVTRDFTQGYGPEVYAIRRAMSGNYKIRTKYYGSSAAKLSGAVTLQVDVYTNYGRINQRRRSITLRLTKSKEEFLVGTIRF
ncbi:DUF2135 domain-containing protein, partial [Myxococcota bacterium]|nr:DUF2135 domain-containing protein [Myxococcota bacterium]